jgi:hypothetical protein
MTLKACVQPVALSPTMMLGRTIAAGSPPSRTTPSASSFVHSYVLRKLWPTSPSCSLTRSSRSPATYAVERWTKRSSAPRSCASMASLTISRVPSTLIRRASSIGSVKLIDAAQCTTAVIELAVHGRQVQARRLEVGGERAHAAAARAQTRRHERPQQLVDARLGGGVVLGANERDDVAVGLLEPAREHLHPDEAGGSCEQ